MAAPGPPVTGPFTAETDATIAIARAASAPAANDIELIAILAHDPVSPTTAWSSWSESGWAAIAEGAIKSSGGTTLGRAGLFWRRAAGGETATINTTRDGDTGNDSWHGARYCYVPGCKTSGDPWVGAATYLATSFPNAVSPADLPGLTLDSADPDAMSFCVLIKGGANGNYGTPTGWTALWSNASTAGTDGSIDGDYRQITAGGGSTFDPANPSFTVDADTAYGVFHIMLLPPAAGQTVAMGTVQDVASVQTISRSKLRALGVVSDVASVQTVARRKTRTVGQASDVGAAQTMGRRKTLVVGQAQDVGQPREILVRPLKITVGPAQDVGAAQTITPKKARSIAQAVDVAVAQALARRKTMAVGTVSQASAAQALGRAKTKVVGPVSSVNLAQALGIKKGVGPAVETGLAVTITTAGNKIIAVGVVSDSGQARPIGKGKGVGPAQDVAVVQPIGRRRTYPVGPASDVAVVQTVIKLQAGSFPVGTVTQVSLAQGLSAVLIRLPLEIIHLGLVVASVERVGPNTVLTLGPGEVGLVVDDDG